MATQIITPAGTYTPLVVTGYETTRAGGAVVHQVLGKTSPDVSLRAAQLRTGTLGLLFADETTATNAFTAVCAAAVLQLTSTERTIGMSFVVPAGQQITYALDDMTRKHWLVSVPFQEVSP